MTIGRMIQAARKEAGMTQVELGSKLGVSGSMIGQWENDLRKPKTETIGRIADALKIPIYKLTGHQLKHDTPENQAIAAEGFKAAFDTMAAFENEIELKQKEQRQQNITAAWKAAEERAGRKLSIEEAMKFYEMETEVYVRLNEAIKKLNNDGRKVALERIEELTLIDKYTLPDIEKHLQKGTEEKPPEDQ